MDFRSPYFDKIRTYRPPEPSAPKGPVCAHPECHQEGLHPAPKGHMHEGQYLFFCLTHVQEYNRTYNYFKKMSESELKRFYQASLTGHHQTWPLGERHASPRWASRHNPYDEGLHATKHSKRSSTAVLALRILGLDASADSAHIKAQYKVLLKRFHPDSNGGDRSCEERLNAVIEAYKKLRALKIV